MVCLRFVIVAFPDHTNLLFLSNFRVKSTGLQRVNKKNSTVKSRNFGHRVNSGMHLQTVEIQTRRLFMSRLIRIFTVCLVGLSLIPIIKIYNRKGSCSNLPDRPNLPDFTLTISQVFEMNMANIKIDFLGIG